jgi:calcium-dependent protein kinase
MEYILLLIRLCEGGELFDRIMDKGFFSEAEAHEIFLQIMQVLNYVILGS